MPVRLRRNDPFSALNLTPLIDVVFFLLIFFMVAGGVDEGERHMDVMLPSAAQTRPMVSQVQELVIHIDQRGALFIGNQAIAHGQLRQSLEQLAGERPAEQAVLIRADRRCQWDAVIHVMDVCHAIGIRDIYPMTDAEAP